MERGVGTTGWAHCRKNQARTFQAELRVVSFFLSSSFTSPGRKRSDEFILSVSLPLLQNSYIRQAKWYSVRQMLWQRVFFCTMSGKFPRARLKWWNGIERGNPPCTAVGPPDQSNPGLTVGSCYVLFASRHEVPPRLRDYSVHTKQRMDQRPYSSHHWQWCVPDINLAPKHRCPFSSGFGRKFFCTNDRLFENSFWWRWRGMRWRVESQNNGWTINGILTNCLVM